ncbi:hypothetical protein AYI68_g7059 [Smittium mucronatum]|uniref:Uncharacterized protein n=1 Tax=Smittium mucronatum TaxID=133383 RepID=A0A1R0GPT5_9FUNG|nr:hypothetical protein AYI68_g7059 [Smittium mucronatum]
MNRNNDSSKKMPEEAGINPTPGVFKRYNNTIASPSDRPSNFAKDKFPPANSNYKNRKSISFNLGIDNSNFSSQRDQNDHSEPKSNYSSKKSSEDPLSSVNKSSIFNSRRKSSDARTISGQNNHEFITPISNLTPTQNRNIFINKNKNKFELSSPIVNAREPFQSQLTSSEKSKSKISYFSPTVEYFRRKRISNQLDPRDLLGDSPVNLSFLPNFNQNANFKPPFIFGVNEKNSKSLCVDTLKDSCSSVKQKLESDITTLNKTSLSSQLRSIYIYRKNSYSLQNAIEYSKMSYYLFQDSLDLFNLIELLVSIGDYKQADYLLFKNCLSFESIDLKIRPKILNLAITISIRVQRMDRLGQLNQILNKSLLQLTQPIATPEYDFSPEVLDLKKENFDQGLQKDKIFKLPPLGTKKDTPKSNPSIKYNLFQSMDVPSIMEQPTLDYNYSIQMSWQWYLCGVSILISNSIDGWQYLISTLKKKSTDGIFNIDSNFEFLEDSEINPYEKNKKSQFQKKKYMNINSAKLTETQAIVRSCWIESIRIDPRCLESWDGLIKYGLANVSEGSNLFIIIIIF